MAFEEYLRGEVAEEFATGLISRRDALRRLIGLGLTATGATALLAACGGDDDDESADPASDATTTSAAAGASSTTPAPTSSSAPANAPRAETIMFRGPTQELRGAWAASPAPRGGLLLIHENRGLTPHFFELAGRMAAAGYSSLAIDLLSREGGTSAASDPSAVLGGAPVERLVADMRAGIDEVERRVPGRKLGAVGFCFGGGMTWQLVQAGEQRLAAAIPFYGPAPDPADFSKSKAAVLGIYAEQDARVNASRDRATQALQRAALVHEIRTFEGADHAFFNDTGPRFNRTAADEAFAVVRDWLARHLG